MFYGMNDAQLREFNAAMQAIHRIYPRIFAGDMLITFERNIGFLQDAAFMAAYRAEARTEQERSLLWRLHVLCWCAANALRLEGDFVECGVFRGYCSAVAARYLDFGKQARKWYLYDTFAGIPPEDLDAARQAEAESYREPGLFESVRRRFAAYPNIQIVQGRVPEILADVSPARIAFMHLDMNYAKAEVGALEVLYDRLVPGGYLLLDDYGWQHYRQQQIAEDAFFAPRGAKVLELPTGQGMLIKPATTA